MAAFSALPPPVPPVEPPDDAAGVPLLQLVSASVTAAMTARPTLGAFIGSSYIAGPGPPLSELAARAEY